MKTSVMEMLWFRLFHSPIICSCFISVIFVITQSVTVAGITCCESRGTWQGPLLDDKEGYPCYKNQQGYPISEHSNCGADTKYCFYRFGHDLENPPKLAVRGSSGCLSESWKKCLENVKGLRFKDGRKCSKIYQPTKGQRFDIDECNPSISKSFLQSQREIANLTEILNCTETVCICKGNNCNFQNSDLKPFD